MTKEHHYQVQVRWTGNLGKGTKHYTTYSRDHLISAEGKKTTLEGSSDPTFLGDPTRYNPEELLLSSLSTCHMLWFLHLCTIHKVNVLDYKDHPTGMMEEKEDGSGQFREVILHPKTMVEAPEMQELAMRLHKEANQKCFIANSCNFEIKHQPEVTVKGS